MVAALRGLKRLHKSHPRINGAIDAARAFLGSIFQAELDGVDLQLLGKLVDDLLGVAAGAGLGATLAVVYLRGVDFQNTLPPAAFAGGAAAVVAAYAIGRSAVPIGFGTGAQRAAVSPSFSPTSTPYRSRTHGELALPKGIQVPDPHV